MDKKLALSLSIAALACQVLASVAAPVTTDKGAKSKHRQRRQKARAEHADRGTDRADRTTAGRNKSVVSDPAAQGSGCADALKGSVDADALKGGVQKNTSGLTMPSHIKLTAEQYKAAVSQYRADIAQFYGHVHNYQGEVSALKKLIGECNENEAQFQQTIKKNQLNISALQMPAITVNIPKPPDVPPSFHRRVHVVSLACKLVAAVIFSVAVVRLRQAQPIPTQRGSYGCDPDRRGAKSRR